MRVIVVVACVVILLAAVVIVRRARGDTPVSKSENLESLRPWLFADVPLAEVAKQSTDEPWINYKKAFDASQTGDTAGAREHLMSIVQSPETRVQLLAWNALRDLGAQPDPKSAIVVRGVVVELHNEGGIGVVAAYEDGRARFFGGTSGGVIWESPGADPEIARLIRALLTSAEPIAHTAPPVPHRNTTPVPMDHVRVTVLTFGGMHIADAYGPELDERSQLAAPLLTSSELLEALSNKRASAK